MNHHDLASKLTAIASRLALGLSALLGFCGWTCASPATFNPFNDTGDFQLDLVYAP